MSRRSLFDSFLLYLAGSGYDIPPDHLDRDVRDAVDAATRTCSGCWSQVYGDDAGPSTVAELLVDLDEGMQEWRYRHVKMVERTIGAKAAPAARPAPRTCGRRCSSAVFPDLWAVRSQL